MQVNDTTRRSNTSIFESSRESTRGRSFKENEWGERHAKAIDDALMFSNSTPSHRQTGAGGIALMLKGWCMFADGAFDSQAIEDSFGGEYWAEIGKSLRQMLNYELGHMDGGTIDTLISEVLENEGFASES